MSVAGSVLLASIPILISLYAEKYRKTDFEDFLRDDGLNLPLKETFDFIIVGGGTAGCLLANRLSAKFTVLLLEVGGNPPPLQSVPILSALEDSLPDVNFLFKTIPQRNAMLDNGGIIETPVGKMLGGSSSHNWMQYERGNPKDYDRWANVSGDKSWRYEHLLPFFKKTEGYTGNLSSATHGRKGDLGVEDASFSLGSEIWEAAGRELGYDLQDSNSFQREGVTRSISTKRRGRRESSYTAFIKPIEGMRKSLTIYRYSAVSQVIFEEKRAVGVNYSRHGVPKVAFADKEVILSAGTYISPLILIKSGVGPEDELKKIKKTPVAVLPVGYNLMDQLLTLLPVSIKNPEYSWNIEFNLTFNDIKNYINTGKGPVSANVQGSSGAFLTSKQREGSDRDWADIQLGYRFFGDKPGMVFLFVGMTAEESRGRVMLNASATSMEDNNLAITDLNYFDKDVDMEAAIDGIELALKFLETKAFKNIGAKFAPQHYKPCKKFEFLSREYLRCYIRQTANTLWHFSGTCKMGLSLGDPSAVVDSNLRVIGTHCLRVVDASVMPFVTNANTAIPTMVIAEKIAAQILDEYENEVIEENHERNWKTF